MNLIRIQNNALHLFQLTVDNRQFISYLTSCQALLQRGATQQEVVQLKRYRVCFHLAQCGSTHPLDRSKSLTLHPLADLFIPAARYSFIQLSELGRRGDNEDTLTSKQYQRGFELWLSRLRVRRSTAEISRSTIWRTISETAREKNMLAVFTCRST